MRDPGRAMLLSGRNLALFFLRRASREPSHAMFIGVSHPRPLFGYPLVSFDVVYDKVYEVVSIGVVYDPPSSPPSGRDYGVAGKVYEVVSTDEVYEVV